ncbi:hypothetical protein [Sphingomonas sp.]|uniref:hypothetical protein n=1 Tax=Sphingomonas sp. TaxID=28214 RepID=UPI003CC5A3D1
MVEPARPQLNSRLPAIAGSAAGALVALASAIMPGAWLDGAIEASGLPAILPVAAPPLGLTARAMMALGGGIGVAAVFWAAVYLLVGPGGPLAARPPRRADDAPTVRRADAHPDAPPRRPLTAAELASPPPPPVEQGVPADLDVPLAAFDPAAVPAVPQQPVRALKPLAPSLAPGERLEIFTLAPPPPTQPATRYDEPPSIDALLRRLEQGARRRVATAA